MSGCWVTMPEEIMFSTQMCTTEGRQRLAGGTAPARPSWRPSVRHYRRSPKHCTFGRCVDKDVAIRCMPESPIMAPRTSCLVVEFRTLAERLWLSDADVERRRSSP